jgi:hypothetical protein
LFWTAAVERELELNDLFSLIEHGEQSLHKYLFFLPKHPFNGKHVAKISFNIGHVEGLVAVERYLDFTFFVD